MDYHTNNDFKADTVSIFTPGRLQSEERDARQAEGSPRFNRLRNAPLPLRAPSTKNFVVVSDIPSHVSPADIASHFPSASTYFPLSGQSKVPIAFEQAHRFDGLAARREAIAAFEAGRVDSAIERSKALLLSRQMILRDQASHKRIKGVNHHQTLLNVHRKEQSQKKESERAHEKEATASIGDQAKILSSSLTGQLRNWFSNLFNSTAANDQKYKEINLTSNSHYPLSYERTMIKPSEAIDALRLANRQKRMELNNNQNLLCYISDQPKFVSMAANQRRFKRSAAKINQLWSANAEFLIPVSDEESLRFVGLFNYRERIAAHDQARQAAGVKRGQERILMKKQAAKAADVLRRQKVFLFRLSEEIKLKKQRIMMATLQLFAQIRRRQFLAQRTQVLKLKFNEEIHREIESKKMFAIEEERARQLSQMLAARSRRKQMLATRALVIKETNTTRSAKAKMTRKALQQQQQRSQPKTLDVKVSQDQSKPTSTANNFVLALSTLAAKTINTITTPRRAASASATKTIPVTTNSKHAPLLAIERESDERRSVVEKSESTVREHLLEAFRTGKMDIRQREMLVFITRKQIFEEKAQAKRASIEVQNKESQQTFVSRRASVEADEIKTRAPIISDELSDFRKILKDEQFERKLLKDRLDQQKLEIGALQAQLQAVNKEIEVATLQLKEKANSKPLIVPAVAVAPLTNNNSTENASIQTDAGMSRAGTSPHDDIHVPQSLRIATTAHSFQPPASQDHVTEGLTSNDDDGVVHPLPTPEVTEADQTLVKTADLAASQKSMEPKPATINASSTGAKPPTRPTENIEESKESQVMPKQEKVKKHRFCC